MQRIGDGEFGISSSEEAHQDCPSMIHTSRHLSLLPACCLCRTPTLQKFQQLRLWDRLSREDLELRLVLCSEEAQRVVRLEIDGRQKEDERSEETKAYLIGVCEDALPESFLRLVKFLMHSAFHFVMGEKRERQQEKCSEHLGNVRRRPTRQTKPTQKTISNDTKQNHRETQNKSSVRSIQVQILEKKR